MINEKEYAKIIAKNLRDIMYKKEKTQADVARDLKINKSTLSSWMNGARTPKMANIDMLCDYFNVPRSALMEVHKKRTQEDVSKEQAELIQLAMHSNADNVRLALDVLKRLEQK